MVFHAFQTQSWHGKVQVAAYVSEQTSDKNRCQVWRDGSVVKSTRCSSAVPKLSSPQLYCSQLPGQLQLKRLQNSLLVSMVPVLTCAYSYTGTSPHTPPPHTHNFMGNLMPSSDLHGHCTHRHMATQTHTIQWWWWWWWWNHSQTQKKFHTDVCNHKDFPTTSKFTTSI